VTGPLGIALTGHRIRLPELLDLVGRAESSGYDVVLVDGDAAVVPGRPDAPIYEGGMLASLALARTRTVRVGSIRLPFFWNAAVLARGLATLQEGSGGRGLAFFGAGVGRGIARIGLPDAGAAERVRWLEETLDALRPLLRGETVTREGTWVRLDRVAAPAVAPLPPIVVAAAGPEMLGLVAHHADVWDANVPPLRERVEPLRERIGRPIETWIWVFARPGAELEEAAAAYRRHCPWFADLPDSRLERAILWGSPDRCLDRLEEMRSELGVVRPIVDLIGLDAEGAGAALGALAPAKRAAIS
jgi:alkanesulfonate monooxygenase SsuD/methylene tetrahydromethanopterin reductase-like flavin-dependent oxidoreductase (luciferase family)